MSHKFSKKELIFIVFTALIRFFIGSVASLQAPFFPAESETHDLKAFEYGTIIALFDLSVTIFSPIWGYYLTEKNGLFAYKLAPFIVGISCVLFGFVKYLNHKEFYIFVCSIIRISEGIGKSLFFVCYFKLTKLYFEEVDDILSVMQGFAGAGCITGPLLGGIIFDAWGFTGTFLSIGGLITVTAFLAVMFVKQLPHIDKVDSNRAMTGFSMMFLTSSVMWISL